MSHTMYYPPPGQAPQASPLEMNTFPMTPQPQYPSGPLPQNQQSVFQKASNILPTSQSPNEASHTAQGLESVGAGNGESTSSQPQDPAKAQVASSSEELELNGDGAGEWNGGSFRIIRGDATATLTVKLFPGMKLWAKPGAMVAMSPTMVLKGTVSFSWKKLITGSDLAKSEYAGTKVPQQGQPHDFDHVVLTPSGLGDIAAIQIDTETPTTKVWKTGKDAFLAATDGVENGYESQSITQAVFSGEGFFVYTFQGYGFLWVQSFGGIVPCTLKDNEEIIIDNHHLVAWDCDYIIQRVASGGIISGISSREGLVCRFRGPGTVYYQKSKLESLATQLKIAGK